MRKLLIALFVVGFMAFMPAAQAATSAQTTCKTFHSFNGNAKVKVCVSAYQNNDTNRTYVGLLATHVTGFQDPDVVNVTLRSWSSPNGNDPWCNGRATGCWGSGNTSAAGGVPLSFFTDQLTPTEHYCTMHGEAIGFIRWPAGARTDFDLNSTNVDTIGAGCILF